MFGTLLESRAKLQRRTGGSVASILIHTAIVGGSVIATARGAIQPPIEPRVAVITLVAPKAPPPPSRPTTVATPNTTIDAPPSQYVLRVPPIVPTEILPADMNAPPTPSDFSAKRLASTGILCERDCSPGRVSDANGNQLWTANDVMMRLREDPVPPRYPESLRRAGIEGSVVVKFAVDTTGRVEMRSIEVIRSTHDAFTMAVRESLEKLRFNPSMIGERRVRALAVMPFQFTLR
jgi:protein TonB